MNTQHGAIMSLSDLERAEQMYADGLDSVYPEVRIEGITFSPSQILKALDPIAYDLGVSQCLEMAEGWDD
jgi:hypothetical protein